MFWGVEQAEAAKMAEYAAELCVVPEDGTLERADVATRKATG